MIVHARTVQGIGDIHWTMKKLYPFAAAADPGFGRVHLTVLTIDNACQVQTRAASYLSLLPRVTFDFEQTTPEEYNRVAALKPVLPLDPADPAWDGERFDYCVNRWLEEGVHLQHIDDWHPQDFIDIGCETPAHVGGLCVFVAGHKLDGLWSIERWADAAQICLASCETKVVRIIGALWDSGEAIALQKILEVRGVMPVLNYAGGVPLRESIGIIRGSELFLGFQSGLSVLADNYDVPNIIVYYPHLRRMMGTWRKSRNSATREITFDDFDLLRNGEIL